MRDIKSKFDAVVYDPRWLPRRGWHDDHRQHDGTDAYLPAVMQVRSEFLTLVDALPEQRVVCLQLGLGPCDASHQLWRCLFDTVISIDISKILINYHELAGEKTHDLRERLRKEEYLFTLNDVDLLFIDAGHSYEDVKQDYLDYAEVVRLGGLIAFHDALPRVAYPEVEVHRFLAELEGVRMVAVDVGTAWVVKR